MVISVKVPGLPVPGKSPLAIPPPTPAAVAIPAVFLVIVLLKIFTTGASIGTECPFTAIPPPLSRALLPLTVLLINVMVPEE